MRNFSWIFLIFLVYWIVSCNDQDNDHSNLKLSQLCQAMPIAKAIRGGVECFQETGIVLKLRLRDEEDNTKICSAILIAPNKALTAGHCFDEFIFSADGELNGKVVPAKNIIYHPEMREVKERVVNDLAIVEFADDLVKELPKFKIGAELEKGDEIYIYGYGADGEMEASAGVLRAGEMTLDLITSDFLFATYNGSNQNVCRGDSGGAAFVWEGGKMVLVGVTSTGSREDCDVGDVSAFVNLNSQSARDFLMDFFW
jgi:hypothetical protein